MQRARHLIVNADDFGQSLGINRGIAVAHEHGIVTSTSLMTRWPGAAEAALYAREHPKLGVGLHVDLGEWVYRAGSWMPLYTVVSLANREAVKKELDAQIAAFRRLLGRDPTHLDSHQHVHLREPARSVLLELSRKLHVPLRHFTPGVHYCGNFYGQTAEGRPFPDFISVEALLEILRTLPDGVTELGCHPGEADDLDTMYGSERSVELKVLCDGAIRNAIQHSRIELCSFANLPGGVTVAA